MLAVVGDQVPQVLSFQFSIGDAENVRRFRWEMNDEIDSFNSLLEMPTARLPTGQAGRRRQSFNSLLEMRHLVSLLPLRRTGVFQFSIGDAVAPTARCVACGNKRPVSILYWRCPDGCAVGHGGGAVRVSILYWRCPRSWPMRAKKWPPRVSILYWRCRSFYYFRLPANRYEKLSFNSLLEMRLTLPATSPSG